MSPTLNFLGPDEPVKLGVQMDDQTAQSVAFIPSAAPGSLPDAWDGTDGFVADAIVNITTNWTISPGAHTLKVRASDGRFLSRSYVLHAALDD